MNPYLERFDKLTNRVKAAVLAGTVVLGLLAVCGVWASRLASARRNYEGTVDTEIAREQAMRDAARIFLEQGTIFRSMLLGGPKAADYTERKGDLFKHLTDLDTTYNTLSRTSVAPQEKKAVEAFLDAFARLRTDYDQAIGEFEGGAPPIEAALRVRARDEAAREFLNGTIEAALATLEKVRLAGTARTQPLCAAPSACVCHAWLTLHCARPPGERTFERAAAQPGGSLARRGWQASGQCTGEWGEGLGTGGRANSPVE